MARNRARGYVSFNLNVDPNRRFCISFNRESFRPQIQHWTLPHKTGRTHDTGHWWNRNFYSLRTTRYFQFFLFVSYVIRLNVRFLKSRIRIWFGLHTRRTRLNCHIFPLVGPNGGTLTARDAGLPRTDNTGQCWPAEVDRTRPRTTEPTSSITCVDRLTAAGLLIFPCSC